MHFHLFIIRLEEITNKLYFFDGLQNKCGDMNSYRHTCFVTRQKNTTY